MGQLETEIIRLRSLQDASGSLLAQEQKRYQELEASVEASQQLIASLHSSLVQEQSRSAGLEGDLEHLRVRLSQVRGGFLWLCFLSVNFVLFPGGPGFKAKAGKG